MTDRAAIYLRVSSVAQAGEDRASLPIQLRDSTAFCERQGWQVTGTEQDTESGKNVTRRGYQAILEMARAGLIDHVVVWAPERFGRRASEVLARYEELKELKVDVVSVTRPMGDWLSMAIQAVIGENELRVMVSRMAPARRYKAAQGYWLPRAPFGTEKDKGILRPGANFDLVRLAFQLCIEGMPLRAITRRLNVLMSPASISNTNVRNLLTNPAYVGIVKWQEDAHPALWEPLIEPSVFDAAGRALTLRYRERLPVNAAAPYWIVGLAYCGKCGNRMAAQIQQRKGRTYCYLRCPRFNRQTVRQDCYHLVPLLPAQEWTAAQFAAANVEANIDRLAQVTAAEQSRTAEGRRVLESELRRLEERIERAEQGYLDGLWGPERVFQIRTSLKDQIASVHRDLAELRPAHEEVDMEAVRDLFGGREWIEGRDQEPGRFRAMLRTLIDRVVVNGRDDYELMFRADRVYTR